MKFFAITLLVFSFIAGADAGTSSNEVNYAGRNAIVAAVDCAQELNSALELDVGVVSATSEWTGTINNSDLVTTFEIGYWGAFTGKVITKKIIATKKQVSNECPEGASDCGGVRLAKAICEVVEP